ncbi:MAG: hypothetical protein ACJAV5_000969 [Vicingaceae bacterium]|jgi:hypothetical protein
MNKQHPKKRTIISFSLALATSLLSIYIQNYTEARTLDDHKLEAKASPIEAPALLETLN